MLPTLINNAAAGYQGPVKIELLKGAVKTVKRFHSTCRGGGHTEESEPPTAQSLHLTVPLYPTLPVLITFN